MVNDSGTGTPTIPPGLGDHHDKSCRLLGVSSALVVDGDLDFWYGFIDSATDNFVVAAHDLDCMAGGVLKGVVIVDNLLVMRSSPVDPNNFYIGGIPHGGDDAAPVALGTQNCYCPGFTPTCCSYYTPSPTSTATPTGSNPPPPPGPTRRSPSSHPGRGGSGSGGAGAGYRLQLYQLEIDGAVVARNVVSQVDAATAPYFVLGGVQVRYDAEYLQVLNVDAPLFISSMENLNQ